MQDKSIKEQLIEITNEALLGNFPNFLFEEVKEEARNGKNSAKVYFFDLVKLKNLVGKEYKDQLNLAGHDSERLNEFYVLLIEKLKEYMGTEIINGGPYNNAWLVLEIKW